MENKGGAGSPPLREEVNPVAPVQPSEAGVPGKGGTPERMSPAGHGGTNDAEEVTTLWITGIRPGRVRSSSGTT